MKKHLATINKEFVKLARKWDDLSVEEQRAYLKRHPKSKRRLTQHNKSVQVGSPEERALTVLSQFQDTQPDLMTLNSITATRDAVNDPSPEKVSFALGKWLNIARGSMFEKNNPNAIKQMIQLKKELEQKIEEQRRISKPIDESILQQVEITDNAGNTVTVDEVKARPIESFNAGDVTISYSRRHKEFTARGTKSEIEELSKDKSKPNIRKIDSGIVVDLPEG